MLWNRFCVVVVSVVAHGRSAPGWVREITLLADRTFPCDELIAWFGGKPRWTYVIRLRGDTEIQGTAAPLGRRQPEREPGSRSRSGLELREALLL